MTTTTASMRTIDCFFETRDSKVIRNFRVTASLDFQVFGDRANLTIEFRSGSTYYYENVKMVDAEEMINAVLNAYSVGEAFQDIRRKYIGVRV